MEGPQDVRASRSSATRRDARPIGSACSNPDTVRKGTPPDAFGLPFPTTIIVDQRGVVVFVKTHGDFRERVKPEEMMAEVVKAREAARPNK